MPLYSGILYSAPSVSLRGWVFLLPHLLPKHASHDISRPVKESAASMFYLSTMQHILFLKSSHVCNAGMPRAERGSILRHLRKSVQSLSAACTPHRSRLPLKHRQAIASAHPNVSSHEFSHFSNKRFCTSLQMQKDSHLEILSVSGLTVCLTICLTVCLPISILLLAQRKVSVAWLIMHGVLLDRPEEESQQGCRCRCCSS